MGIASTAFAPFDNDMTKVGRAFKLSLDRVGWYGAAERTTYKYKDDGSYHYPKRDSNISHNNGEQYWVPTEGTGFNEGTWRDPKFILLIWFLTKEIPKLEAIARKVYALTGKNR